MADPGWTSFSPAPPYPDHPSGYSCVSGGFFYTAKEFFGRDKFAFSVVRVAPNVPNVIRNYTRFTDVAEDTIDARLYQGIHFRSAEEQGAKIGKKVAEWLDDRFFEKVEDEDDEDEDEDD